MKKEFEEIRKSKYFKYIVAFGIMKKEILLAMATLIQIQKVTITHQIQRQTKQMQLAMVLL